MLKASMPRKPRIEFDGAFYHVLVRGNQKQKIFLDKKDFRKYLQILGDYKSLYSFSLYGYVLMPNHVHLLVETGKIPLSKILQGINQRYTMYFNWKYDTVGHLFQGRYKAILCNKEEYLLNLIKYIHNNPVRAGLVERADEYPWSSHELFLKPEKKGIADTHIALGFFAGDSEKAARAYREFMGEEGISKKDLEKTVDQRILGGDEFIARILEKEQEPARVKRQREFSLEEIAGGIREAFKICEEELLGKSRNLESVQARSLFCFLAKEYGYKGIEIAGFLGRDPGGVTKYLHRGEKLQERIDEVLSILKK